jgi:acetyl esterase
MNQVIQTVLAAFSNQNIEINTARKLANLKKLDPLHLWVEKEDIVIKTECGKIPLRLYFPSEETKKRFPPRFFLSMEEDGLQRV